MGRFAAKQPSAVLQAVVLFDEASLYLPAVGEPVTKEPMENALKRWRPAGLGVLLASQSLGDSDYKCRDNVRAWFVGRVKEDTALNKMRPMLREAKTDITAKLARLGAGQFFVVRDGQVEGLSSSRSLITAQQLTDAEILRISGDQPPRIESDPDVAQIHTELGVVSLPAPPKANTLRLRLSKTDWKLVAPFGLMLCCAVLLCVARHRRSTKRRTRTRGYFARRR